jgi:hypothetical protein
MKELGQISHYSDQAMHWRTRELRFNSWNMQEIILSSTASKLNLGPAQFPTQWVVGVLP